MTLNEVRAEVGGDVPAKLIPCWACQVLVVGETPRWSCPEVIGNVRGGRRFSYGGGVSSTEDSFSLHRGKTFFYSLYTFLNSESSWSSGHTFMLDGLKGFLSLLPGKQHNSPMADLLMGGEPGERESNRGWFSERSCSMWGKGDGGCRQRFCHVQALKWCQQAFSEHSHFLEEPLDSS